MAYERVNWENLPSTKTPVNADNLNKMDEGIANIDTKINSKANSADVYTKTEIDSKLDNILKLVYPVGAIYISVNSTSPATLFGGKWERIARGRTLVGEGIVEDNNDNWCGKTKKGDWTAYAGKMGGEVTHTLTLNELPNSVWHSAAQDGGVQTLFNQGTSYGIKTQGNNMNKPHNNLPPYFVVYMWKRIS